MVGGIISTIGLKFKKVLLIDFGLLISGLFYFYFQHEIPLTYGNIFFIVIMFFLFFGCWVFMRRAVLIDYVEKDLVGERGQDHLKEYKNHSVYHYLWVITLGFIVTILGSLIAVHGFIADFPAEVGPYMLVLLSGGVILSVYVVVVILPKYFAVN